GLAIDWEIITIEVLPILNFPPTLISIGDRTAFIGKTLSIDADATDPENDPLIYGHNATFGDSFNTTNGVYNWTPNATGLFMVNFNVTDGNASDNETIRINVKNLTEAGAFPRIVTNNSLNSTPWRGEHFLVENFENWALGPINATSNGFWNTSRSNTSFKGNWTVSTGLDENGNPTIVLNHTTESPPAFIHYLFVEEPSLKGRFQNFTFQVKVRIREEDPGNDDAGIAFRWNDTSRASGYRLYKSGETFGLYYVRNSSISEEDGVLLNSSFDLVFPNNVGWIRVIVDGEMIYVYNSTDGIDFGSPAIIRNISGDAPENRNFAAGSIGLFGNENVTYDDIMATEHLLNQTFPDTDIGLAFHNENLTGTYLYTNGNGLNQTNVTFRWFNNGILNVTQFNSNLSNINSTIDSSKTRKDDIWQFEVVFCDTAGKCRTEISQKVKIINIEPIMDPLQNITMFVNTPLTIDANATDGNNDKLTYNHNATFGDSFNPDTGVFIWTPNTTGNYRIKFNVTDTEDVDEKMITIKVEKIANETEGRNATEIGTNSSLPETNRTIFTDQQVYLRYEDNDQKIGTFDKFVNSTSQRWMFNYNFSNNPFTNMTNISNILNTWERENMTEENITAEVSLFINRTKT
ncbi:hypothetical protein HYS48_05090, partial [Candidatus Woesearchaeota archaeon]|nr:hypothetical protein [Candidatus Woesearchaeota archaeon]